MMTKGLRPLSKKAVTEQGQKVRHQSLHRHVDYNLAQQQLDVSDPSRTIFEDLEMS